MAYQERSERKALGFLLFLLGINVFLNAAYGFVLPVFLATVPVAGVLSFFFPRAGFVAALVMTVFFERFFTLSPMIIGDVAYKLYPLDIVLLAVLLSSLLSFLREGRDRFRFRGLDLWILGFFGFVSILFLAAFLGWSATDTAVAFSTWKNYVFYGLLVFLLPMIVRDAEDMRWLARLFLTSVAFAGVFLLIGVLRGEGLWTEYTPLSTSGVRLLAFPHAFYFSLALIVLLFSLPLWMKEGDTKCTAVHNRYPLARIMIFVGVLALGISGSLMRHLWLGLGATILAGLMVAPGVFGKQLFALVSRFVFPAILFLSAAWFLLSVFPQSEAAGMAGRNMTILVERIASIGDGYDESLAWRGAVWESALTRFSEHPFLGIGFGASVPVEMGDYRQYVEVRNMHNSWLALLIQTGIVGASLLAGYILSLCVALLGRSTDDPLMRQARFVLLGLLLFQGLVFFSQPYLETNLLGMFFWITLGLMRSIVSFGQKDIAERK